MELLLSNETPIRRINREFQKYFPYLKIEFFRHKRGRPCINQLADGTRGPADKSIDHTKG